jgi:ribonucleotide reductase beta subunit family protein with ferritin-like domain
MAKKRNLLQERIIYKPFEYPEAYDYWLKQQQAHWLHTEVPMMSDLTDWNSNLNETEKNIIGSILKRLRSNRNSSKRLLDWSCNKMVP